MEVGAAVWVLEDDLWREAAVLAVDDARGVAECALEPEDADERLVLAGDDGAHEDAASAAAPGAARRRRNSRLARRGSLRRTLPVPLAAVLPRHQGEAYHAVEDLTKLVHLHEPAILQVLRHRFFHGGIYTSTGSILLALNPFRKLDDLYADAVKAQYYALGADPEAAQALAPHVYGVADKAFRTMLARAALALHAPAAYAYLNASECYVRLDGVDDAASYRETRHAMTALGMDADEQLSVMKVVSAVLHLGNVAFVAEDERGKEASAVAPGGPSGDAVAAICRLLGVREALLRSTLCTKQIKAGAEFITTTLSAAQAASTRDSVVKTLYANLFRWLVARINASIEYADEDAFAVSRLQRGKRQFVIHHYAGSVCYSTNGFCEKNKDHMHTEATDLMKTSTLAFVRAIFETADAAATNTTTTTSPTARKKAETGSGGGDATRRRSGIMSATNYSCILGQSPTAPASQLKAVAAALVAQFTTQFRLQTDAAHPPFQVGKTKVFCVPAAHNALEAARAKALYQSVVTLQRYCMGYAARRAYQRQRQCAVRLQATWRRTVCRRRFLYLVHRARGATKLQAAARGFLCRRVVKRGKAVTVIQSFVRGWLVRRELSANTLSFDHDVSFVGSIDDRTTDDSLDDSFSVPSSHKGRASDRRQNPLVSMSSAPPSERGGSEFAHELNDPDGRYGGHSPNQYRDSKKRLEAYEPPKQIKHEYEIVWECGLLGLYFESDPMSGMPIVRRVHESLSNCADIFEVSRGDVLLAVGKVKVKKGDIRRILSLLQEVQKPVRLHFLRNPTESFRMRSGSIELLGEEDYEVLWKEGVPLGLGFRPDAGSGYPCVMQANGNQSLPGMFNVRIGDFLIFINEFSTQGVRFQKVIDILESGPRPAVLRFRHNDTADDMDVRGSNPQEDDRFMRQSCISLNPKVDHSLYYITWKEDDGPLGIVVKQESTSYYPRVINVKNEGAVTRESQKNRVEVGDILLSINNNNISKMGFGAAMRLLQKGPKPLLLMFQRPRESFSTSLTQSLNL
ncbi:hypothetical protein PybrP1_008620 [[Pythium] brassicae (nom. inval.)]|nr:hypothetical protein PybrP1_008620 [[Pythium] brassicae (nom. inval.)]